MSQDWTILFYLCSDGPDEQARDEARLQSLVRATASRKLAIAVQRKGPEGVERFIIPKSKRDALPEPEPLGAVSAVEPSALLEFLRWGLESFPARHTALILSGRGVTGLQNPPDAPDDEEIFTFCANALTPLKLQQALTQALNDADKSQIDLLGFDMAAGQFIELAYQLLDCADWMIASPPDASHSAWDYGKFIRSCHRAHRKSERLTPQQMTELMAAGAASALNLNRLESVIRVFDALAMALLQSLGDDIIWDVVWDAENKIAFNFSSPPSQGGARGGSSLDLRFLLQSLRDRFEQAAEEVMARWYSYGQDKLNQRQQTMAQELIETPNPSPEAVDKTLSRLPDWKVTEYHLLQSQSKRAADLANLAQRALDLLEPSLLSIFCPLDLGKAAKSGYASLAFNRRVHWDALLGAINLIADHPRALWRLTSSLLTTSSGVVRQNLLRRLIGPDSVMVGFREQFRALAAPPKLTLSLEPVVEQGSRGAEERGSVFTSLYRLRLETYDTGATVVEQNSPVNTRTIEDALRELERLLQDPWANPNALDYLDSLGRILGEDIIQNLAGHLSQAYRQAAQAGDESGVPHLQLQLPRHLMRYPWELMHDSHGLLCDRYALGRQIFMEAGLARQVTRRRKGVIRALIIGDPKFNPDFLARAKERGESWAQLPGAAEEAEQAALTFERLARTLGGAVDFQYSRDVWIHKNLSKLKLRELLRNGDYDIVHFAGHAIFTPERPEQSAWLLSDGPLWAQEIRNTLAWIKSPPWLVFANACQAAMDSGGRANRYQGDVFGLATAFINQGVTAYIAPLWPINDAVAQQIAIDFYYSLLLDYTSLGEALRRAKQEARQIAAGGDPNSKRALSPLSTQIGLSWASLVLYGDPGARLMESLWTPHHLPPGKVSLAGPEETPPIRRKKLHRPLRPLQASVDETLALATGPGMTALPVDATRGADAIPADKLEMKLVEVNGLRYWQVSDGQSGQTAALPGSPMKALTQGESARRALGLQRGAMDYARIIGRWLIDRGKESLVEGLIEQYDRDMVPQEKLWSVGADGALNDMPQKEWTWLDGNVTSGSDRVLLIIHGTFSKAASPVNGLKGDFLDWATRHYRGVIAFDHWTLSKSPDQNAKMLWELLDPALKKGTNRLDIVTHSRGGLVARAFVEMLRHHRVVNKVAFICTPNSGTTLANPENWGRAADMLINMLHLDNLGMFGRLSGFLARLAAISGGAADFADKLLRQIPGLWAQNPNAVGRRDFLGKLQRGDGPPEGVAYAAIAANYEPHPNEVNIKSLSKTETLKAKAADKGQQYVDASLDTIFGAFNDLVVDTARVWAIDRSTDEISISAAPAWLPGQRLLVYNPNQEMDIPDKAATLDRSGVHHTNVFLYPETHQFLKEQLSD